LVKQIHFAGASCTVWTFTKDQPKTEPNVGKYFQVCHLYMRRRIWVYDGLCMFAKHLSISSAPQRRSLAYNLVAAVKGSTSCSKGCGQGGAKSASVDGL